MVVFATALIGLTMMAEPSGGTIASENTAIPRYHLYDFESACGNSMVRVRFRDEARQGTRVDHVLVDGDPVPGATKILDRFAVRRKIDRIEIMHCGMDPLRPIFRGVMKLSKPESQPSDKQNTIFFRLTRRGKGWQMSVD
jgi:hypothetical protein